MHEACWGPSRSGRCRRPDRPLPHLSSTLLFGGASNTDIPCQQRQQPPRQQPQQPPPTTPDNPLQQPLATTPGLRDPLIFVTRGKGPIRLSLIVVPTSCG